MNKAITIIDPNAPAAPEVQALALDWTAAGVAGVVVLLTALGAHRVIRRRLRASALELASEALVRRLGLGRAGRRAVRRLAKHAECPPGLMLLDRSVLSAALARHQAAEAKASVRLEVDRVFRRLSGGSQPTSRD